MSEATILMLGLGAIALFVLVFVVLTGRRLGGLDTRITGVEAALKHLPNRDDLHRIEVAMERMAGGMDARREREVALGRSVDRIENWLLNADKLFAHGKKESVKE